MYKINIKKLGVPNPAIGGIPSTYLESLSYEEQLMWFCKNLKSLIDNASSQNEEIEDAVDYMETNIEETTTSIINNLVETQQIYVNVNLSYNEEDEEITIGGEIVNE